LRLPSARSLPAIGACDFENDDGDDSEQYEIPDDLAASHPTKTAENYGVTIDVLKRLTAESLEIFGQVSCWWHKFLGLIERHHCHHSPP
jgi:hypothetical protein